MGVAHIMFVHEDGIGQQGQDAASRAAFQKEVGSAVLKLCLDASYAQGPDGVSRLRSHGLRSHGNAVNWVDAADSSETRVFVWDRNCLQTLSEVSGQGLAAAEALIEREMASRQRSE